MRLDDFARGVAAATLDALAAKYHYRIPDEHRADVVRHATSAARQKAILDRGKEADDAE